MDNLVAALEGNAQCESVTVFSMGLGSRFNAPNQVTVPVPRRAAGRQIFGDAALARALVADPVDVVLCPGNEVARVAGVPSVMWPLTVAPFEDSAMRQLGSSLPSAARWRVLRASVGRAVGRADAFVFSSHYTRALYSENFPRVATSASTVLPPAPSLHPEVEGEATLALPGRYVLFVSHLYPYKMVDELIRGFAVAVGRGVSQDLVLAGHATHPEYKTRVLDRVAQLGLRHRVHFLGSVDGTHLPHLYRNADLFVFPSISENAGSYALLDAFGFGTPVLSSSTSSMPEACQQAARYFDPRDPEQLGTEMAQLLLDTDGLVSLAAASRARGQELPSWDDTAAGFIDFAKANLGRRVPS